MDFIDVSRFTNNNTVKINNNLNKSEIEKWILYMYDYI